MHVRPVQKSSEFAGFVVKRAAGFACQDTLILDRSFASALATVGKDREDQSTGYKEKNLLRRQLELERWRLRALWCSGPNASDQQIEIWRSC